MYGWLILPSTLLNNTVGYSDPDGWFLLLHATFIFLGHLLFIITKEWLVLGLLSIFVLLSSWGACELFTHISIF